MEYDRYAHHHVLYILGILSLIFTLILSMLTLYVTPFLLVGWRYKVPGFIIEWLTTLRYDYRYSETASAWVVFLLLLVPAILFGFVAFFTSNRIDNAWAGRPLHIEEGKRASVWKQDLLESTRVALKIGILMLIVAGIAWLF